MLLFLCGNFKKFKTILNYATNKRLCKYRVIKIFESLSKKLILDQKECRLIVYKNFDYNYRKFSKTFKNYTSNKCEEWTQRNNIIRHFYADLYEYMLENKDIKNLLQIEIGLGSEIPVSSLKSWKELPLNANIYGACINKIFLFEEDRIKTFYTN